MDNDGNKTVKVKETGAIKALQALTFILAFFALILGLVVAGGFFSRLANGTTDQMSLSITEPTVFTTVTEPTVPPTPSPTPFVINENLDFGEEKNALCEEYFGPLPEVDEPVPLRHKEVKGIYVGAAFNMEANYELAANSEINAFVLDLKEYYGVLFDSKNEVAKKSGSVNVQYDLKEICDECHSRDIYVIGRIVVFKDPMLIAAEPDRAICDSSGTPLLFSNEGSSSFLSPYDTRNWDYHIELALEALDYGVDEIQFDYVRFPTGSSTTGNKAYFGVEGEVPDKYMAIDRFLQTARRRIQDTTGTPVSADIFGIAVSSPLDGEILGQDWSNIGFTGVDSLCPMIYPSHYALGTMMNGHVHEFPDKAPYQVMFDALSIGSQYHTRPGYSTVRPYCQAFTASYIGAGNYMVYDYTAINDQIRAIEDTGLSEFILWNAGGEYPSGQYGGNNG